MFTHIHNNTCNNQKAVVIPKLTKSDIRSITKAQKVEHLYDKATTTQKPPQQHRLVTHSPKVISDHGRWHVTCSVQDSINGRIHTVACSGVTGGKEFSSVCSACSTTLCVCEHAVTVLLACVDTDEEERRRLCEALDKNQSRKRSFDATTSAGGVFVVLQAMSEMERGYSYGDHRDPKEHYNPEILGVFRSLPMANERARKAIQEIKENSKLYCCNNNNSNGDTDEDDNSSDDDDDDSNDSDPIQWKGEESSSPTDGEIPSVWVEHHDIQDSPKRSRR
ncbi:expressed unknown protein [Seminavis robusta]|uniref:Uncharacterized protein n=1 Tax=Seminavis robusta TaxID=568900 RepID=A0A9N8DZ94_9STRA|nr:expressed unknown protein [Seminavis robusta]|eukprot:Sro489_g153360.1 n/a (278) ;mRNA; r:51044-51877